MNRDKHGVRVFDSLSECHNYIDKEMTEKKLRKRALKSKKAINYDDPILRARVIHNAIMRLPKCIERQVIGYLFSASNSGVSEGAAVNYLACKILNTTPEHVLKLKQKAIEMIKDKLSLVVMPASNFL